MAIEEERKQRLDGDLLACVDANERGRRQKKGGGALREDWKSNDFTPHPHIGHMILYSFLDQFLCIGAQSHPLFFFKILIWDFVHRWLLKEMEPTSNLP